MSQARRFIVIALCLVGMALAARVAEEAAVARLTSDEGWSERYAERTVQLVEHRLLELERELIARARGVASLESVREALRDPLRRGQAVETFERLRLPDDYAVELYTPLPELIAWRGPGLPLDPAVRRLEFLEVVQSAAVNDGTRRRALAVWLPIEEHGRVLGAVRVLRVLSATVPVQNQYLQEVDLIARWSRGRLPGLTADFDHPLANNDVGSSVIGVDGYPLVYLRAQVPERQALVSHTRSRFGHAIAFFLALAGGWFVAGLALLADGALTKSIRGRVLLPSAVVWCLAVFAALAGFRYAVLALGVPSRFVAGPAAPAAFDPAFLGSGFGGGIAASTAELAITAFIFLISALFAVRVAWYLWVIRRAARQSDAFVRGKAAIGAAALASAAGVALLAVVLTLIARATEDATLGFLDRAGPLPEALVLLVFGAFVLLSVGVLTWLVALGVAAGLGNHRSILAALLVLAIGLAVAFVPLGAAVSVHPFIALAFVAVALVVLAWYGRSPEQWYVFLSFRGAVMTALVAAALTYPIVFGALSAKEEARLRDAVQDFAEGEDPRVAFALESVLLDARDSDVVRAAMEGAVAEQALPPGLADSLAADLVTGSLLAALADYRVGLTLHAPDGEALGRYLEEAPVQVAGRVTPAPMPPDPVVFSRMRRMYEEEALFAGFAVERRPAGTRGGKYRYAGFGPVRAEDDGRLLGWITARAEPRAARYVAETPFPRVLVPAGLYRHADEEWIFAEFVNGVLHRSRGAYFGRFRLPDALAALRVGESAWRSERLEGQPVKVLYQRVSEERLVAARIPATTVFDHLYFLLRILTAGLLLAGVAFLMGVVVRRTAGHGRLRPRLRDRVLNRFLFVGLIAVVATGIIGREVIVTQNRDAVEERLKRQLARVEAALFEEVGEEVDEPVPPEMILDRARPDLVGARLGLDVNIYRGAELVASSRSQLVRQRLIERRLPVEVVRPLFVDGERYAFATERIGQFRYTTGYEVIPDARGFPAVVIAVPTLPEQFAIEADQARMVAYLFGVLLLLLLLIFGVATVLASRLTSPFRRLREGLRAVGAGEAPAEPIPVERRDEVGEVIETFNAVWDQLEESRRRLAAHERELAWREMARQVAHEIKNPLTPMRLSVQHLRRAFERVDDAGETDARFEDVFDRISNTLLEQIDALNRIAGEFSHFGRMPERDLQRFDLNEVLRQAAALVAEEPRAEIILDLSPEPLPVRADKEELRRVYINLLKNAQQAIDEGEHGLITLASRRLGDVEGTRGEGDWAETSVADTGSGIPAEIQPRIFRPNFSTKTSGMGLGLAIARKTVEDLGGEIDFETEPGVGTTFYVRLALDGSEG